MTPFATLTGNEITIAIVILFFFLVSIVISLTVRNRDLGEDGGMEHFDHEHGDPDAR